MTEKKTQTMTLPPVIPVFPLSRVILIPGSSLPLNIFEPRYVQMVKAAASGNGLIGMIQPLNTDDPSEKPALQRIGGVGKIEDLAETGKDQFAIRLRGLARFEVREELSVTTLYRQVQADWHAYADYNETAAEKAVDRRQLLTALTRYLDHKGLEADFEAISEAPDDVLVNTLSMIVPLGIKEKQALLEVRTVGERCTMLQALLNMTVAEANANEVPTQLH